MDDGDEDGIREGIDDGTDDGTVDGTGVGTIEGIDEFNEIDGLVVLPFGDLGDLDCFFFEILLMEKKMAPMMVLKSEDLTEPMREPKTAHSKVP